MDELQSQVIEWARARRLLERSDVFAQFSKFLEEVDELAVALKYDTLEQIELELGDVLVTLTLVAYFAGISWEVALSKAIAKITDRTGRIVDGVFVKD